MDKSQIEDIYPLTPMQEGLLFQTLFDSESAAYFLQIRLNWQGNLQVERFRDSWRQLMQRHVVLRSVFVHEGVKRPVQITLKSCLLYTSPSPRDGATSRMPSSA